MTEDGIRQKAEKWVNANTRKAENDFGMTFNIKPSPKEGYIAGATEIMNEMKCCGNCESPSNSCNGCKDLSNWRF